MFGSLSLSPFSLAPTSAWFVHNYGRRQTRQNFVDYSHAIQSQEDEGLLPVVWWQPALQKDTPTRTRQQAAVSLRQLP